MRKILIGLAAILAIGAGSYVWTLASPTELQSEVVIDAAPEEVWAVLTDLESYHDWNPFIVSSEGDARVGEQLTNVLNDDGSTMTFKPEVLVADGQEFRWIGRFGVPGIADGEHYFQLEDLGDGRTRLTQGESFTGVLVPFAGGSLDVEDGFDAMNKALKERVEDAT